MKKLKVLILFALVALVTLIFLIPKKAQGMEDSSSKNSSQVSLASSSLLHSAELTDKIRITLPNSITIAVKSNLDLPLSDLRATLNKAGMPQERDFLFHFNGDSILPSHEKNWIIREVIKDGALSLQAGKSSFSHLFKNIEEQNT